MKKGIGGSVSPPRIMNTVVIAIANQKGGVGKTTTAVNLSACLVERRRHVLLIDLDPQANATSALGVEKTAGASLYRALLGDGGLREHIRPTAYRRFDLVPSEIDLAGAEVDLVTASDYLHRLDRLLKPLAAENEYDFIFIDCPPSLGMLTINGLASAHAVLIPLQCEYLALEGLGSITGVINELRVSGANPSLRIHGIVMTMFDKRTRIAQQVVEEVVRHFPERVYDTLIPRNVRLSEAPSYGKPVIVYDPQSPGAVAYRMLAAEFLKRCAAEGQSASEEATAPVAGGGASENAFTAAPTAPAAPTEAGHERVDS